MSLLAFTSHLKVEADKTLKKTQAAGAARQADALLSEEDLTANIVLGASGSPALLQELLNSLKNSTSPTTASTTCST